MSIEIAEPEYSELIKNLRYIYDTSKAMRHRYIIVFCNSLAMEDPSSLTSRPLRRSQDFSATSRKFHEQTIKAGECYSFIAGLDLDIPFERQVPEHLHKITSFDALANSPIEWIPDAKGRVPSAEREKFLEGAFQTADILPFPPRGNAPITNPPSILGSQTAGGIRLVVDNKDAPAPLN